MKKGKRKTFDAIVCFDYIDLRSLSRLKTLKLENKRENYKTYPFFRSETKRAN